MNGTGKCWRVLSRAVLAGIGLAMAGCSGGGASGSPPASPPPSSAHTAAEQAAVMNWLLKTNLMRTQDDFAGLGQVTTGQMTTLYQSEQRQASLPVGASRVAFQLTGLSVTIPCQTGAASLFVAYASTDVFDLGSSAQSVAMVFERTGGQWKLATAVNHSQGSGWPALCTRRPPPAAAAVLPPGSYTPDLARVLTRADSGTVPTSQTAAPFAVNGFLDGPGSIPALSATQIRQDRQGGVAFGGRFAPAPDPTFALPLASGRGFWIIGDLVQSDTYSAPAGERATDWPDGNQVATPRPAVVHQESDTFATTYTAIDPLRPGAVTLDGFFGWPLTAVAS